MQTILQFIGLFLLMILSFLGANYLMEGDIFVAGALSLVLVIIMYFLIEFLKKRKVEITKNKFSTTSILLWTAFTVVCLPISYLVVHALNVEINAKKDLQAFAKELNDKNNEIVGIFQTENQQYISQTYLEASNSLEAYVTSNNKSVKDTNETKLSSPRFGISDLSQINKSNYLNKATALQSALEIKSQAMLDSVTKRTETTINENYHLVENWSRLRVVVAIKELENMLNSNANQLKRFLEVENYKKDIFLDVDGFTVPEQTANNSITYRTIDFDISDFSKLWDVYAPIWLFFPVLLFFGLLLLPYFLEKTAGVYDIKSQEDPMEGGIEI